MFRITAIIRYFPTIKKCKLFFLSYLPKICESGLFIFICVINQVLKLFQPFLKRLLRLCK